MMQPDDPPFLTVGTEVSAKYKGAFCEAKVNKVVKVVKVKVTFKYGLGSAVVSDDSIKGVLKVGAQVKALHPDKNQHLDGTVNKIQDCSQYTVVFDDGDITTLRRSSLCLKSGRHFAESETLDQLPLTHPEHFGTPVVGGRRGRRSRHHADSDDASSDEEDNVHKRHRSQREEWESDIGKVVCVEIGDKKKQKDNWFPGLVVAPTAQDSVKIETKKDYLVRSFQDGRYYTVPKKEATEFSREIGSKVTQSSLRTAVEKALLYIDKEELPPHWDRDLLFGVDMSDLDLDKDSDSDTSDDEPREEKDHFVAQLYKFMEECGTPINKGPTIGAKDLDLYKLFKVVQKLGGFNRVMNQNQWKIVSLKMGLHTFGFQSSSLVKAAYKKYLQSFEDFYRKLGCTMVSNPRGSRTRHRSGRSLIRDCDKRPTKRKGGETDSAEETDRKDEDGEEDDEAEDDAKHEEKPQQEDQEEEEEEEQQQQQQPPPQQQQPPPPQQQQQAPPPQQQQQAAKKEEASTHRTYTSPVPPARTMSPTTRERAREMKGARPDMKLRVVGKALTRESKAEDSRKKDAKGVEESGKKKDEPPTSLSSSTSSSSSCRKSRVDELRRKESKDEEPKTRSSTLREERKVESESEEEEVEKTQTRSLRNREDKDKEAEIGKKVERKTRQDHPRSASCNSTSSGTSSSSTCTSSSTSNATDGKGSAKGKIRTLKCHSAMDELRKRGRKKRSDTEGELSTGKPLLPAHVPINIGDKLRVLYGPNNKESKVTYEAKVLEVEENPTPSMYYVHYLGWNTRYDEWVVRQRVAQNLTWSQSRSKKSRAASKEMEEKKEEKKETGTATTTTTTPATGTTTTLTSRVTQPPKRGRPLQATRRESERSDSASSTRASTRSEKGSRSHSHSVSPCSERTERRRSKRKMSLIRSGEERKREDSFRTRRRGSDDTEESDSDEYESGHESTMETDAPPQKSNDEPQDQPPPVSDTSENVTMETPLVSDVAKVKLEPELIPEPEVQPQLPTSKPSQSQPQPKQEASVSTGSSGNGAPGPVHQSSCGKDIDLKAIESEMKGLDRPIKKEADNTLVKEVAGRILTTVIPGSLTITEKKKHDPKKPFDSPVKRVEIPVRLVPAQEIMGQIKPVPLSGMKKEPLLLEDDIYEFKEPEPFEFSDIRGRKECKTRVPGSGTPEEAEPEAKVKKKGRPKREGEEKSESESDGAITPQKKGVPSPKEAKESPSPKRPEGKDQLLTVKKELKDYGKRPETASTNPEEKVSKEELKDVKEPPKIASPPCVPFREVPPAAPEAAEKPFIIDFFAGLKEKQVPRMPLDFKDIKFDLSDSKESHFIGSSVVITPKKLALKKESLGAASLEAAAPSTKVESSSLEVNPPRALKIELKEEPSASKDVSKVGMVPGATSGKVKPIAVMIDRSSSQVLTRIPGAPGHVLAQVVMPPVESRVLAKPVIKSSVDQTPEKNFTLGPGTSVQTLGTVKQEERSDGKLMPFSQRQQHIFPHLLSRPDPASEDKGHEVTIQRAPPPPVIPTTPVPVSTAPAQVSTPIPVTASTSVISLSAITIPIPTLTPIAIPTPVPLTIPTPPPAPVPTPTRTSTPTLTLTSASANIPTPILASIPAPAPTPVTTTTATTTTASPTPIQHIPISIPTSPAPNPVPIHNPVPSPAPIPSPTPPSPSPVSTSVPAISPAKASIPAPTPVPTQPPPQTIPPPPPLPPSVNHEISSLPPSCSSPLHSPSKGTAPSPDRGKTPEKTKSESTVEESIEAVVSRARQDQMSATGEPKRRRTAGRTKKALNRDLVPDTSEESDSDPKAGDPRPKRSKGNDGAKYSPARKAPRTSVEGEKKGVRRCDEDDRGNDADEEDDEGSRPPSKREMVRRRKESEGEGEKTPSSEREPRPPKKKRLTTTSRRLEDSEEPGLGDLLCEETIPPGSPMPQDALSSETEAPPHTPAPKQEMPFASVPTGSSFSKRSAPSSHTSHPTSLQMSLQQLHPSLCIQSVSKVPPSTSATLGPIPPPTIQPNVTITSLNPNGPPPPLPTSKITSLSFRGPTTLSPSIPAPALLRPPLTKATPEIIPKPAVTPTSLYVHEGSNIKTSGASGSSLVIAPVEPSPPPKNEEPKVPSTRSGTGPLPSIDNTPPTTPESMVSNLSDSPQRENESSKHDESSKNGGQYSSEMDIDNKVDNYSEDSNTMDSNASASKSQGSKRPPSVGSRGGPCHQSHSEDTEDGTASLAPPKRRKRGSKAKGHVGEEDSCKGMGSSNLQATCSSSRRRRRHSSSRGSSKGDEDSEASHGLNTLSMAACNSSRGRSRYNFCQELDPDLDAGKRIAVLQSRMQELKRTYMQVKAELASVERRRKKLRKKEREKEAQADAN